MNDSAAQVTDDRFLKKKTPVFNTQELSGTGSDNTESQLKDFDIYRVTKEKAIPILQPTATIDGTPIIKPKNFTSITAEAKGGKTAAANVFIAGAISLTGDYDGFQGLYIEANHHGKAVIHFDTEQSEDDQQYNLRTVLKRANIEVTPDYYLSYNTRTLPITSYQEITSTICDLASERFKGIHLIVIDGGADYVNSVNDEAEANAMLKYFTALSEKHECGLLLVIHLNENAGRNGDTMPRGHIGRQAVRKGYCQLHITKSGDISTMQILRGRKAGSDTPLICYQYSKEKGYHISVDPEIAKTKSNKSSNVRNGLEKICQEILPLGTSFGYMKLVSKIMQLTDKSEPTAKRYVTDLLGWEAIKKGEDGNYRINDEQAKYWIGIIRYHSVSFGII